MITNGNGREEPEADRLLIDTIHRSILRIKGTGAERGAAPTVFLINLSMGDLRRPFAGVMSPLARLLDFLAHKYSLLFLVSAGNILNPLKIADYANWTQFEQASPETRERAVIKSLDNAKFERTILSPAEALNVVTVGARHHDNVTNRQGGVNALDPLQNAELPNITSALGLGYRRMIKPDLYFSAWSRHQIDLFVTALGKLGDTFWKIARTAELYDLARCRISHIKPPSISTDDLAATQQALRDIPLHLDCVLLYVRIFADCVASLTSQLFPSQNVPFRSFRDQMKWFTQKQPNVDPQYAEILEHHAGWFTTLAGDGETEGLRDLIVHRLVRTELIFQPGATPAENRIHSFLYGVVKETTHTTQSLESLITPMMAELFEFLDYYVIHFATRVGSEYGSRLIDWGDPRSSLWFQIEGEYRAEWLFPLLSKTVPGNPKQP